MEAAYLSAFSALAGSAVGAVASFATTWLTQRYQERTQRVAEERSRREKLLGDFIDQASKLYADALTHAFEDPAKVVPLYAIRSKLRLFASQGTIEKADLVMNKIIYTYYRPNEDFHGPRKVDQDTSDLLRAFTEAGRAELQR